MLSIAEWTDRDSALSSPMKLTSSANFSPSIRISLRLKIHQAQAKNFCRVLDIRVPQIMEAYFSQAVFLNQVCEPLRDPIRAYQPAELINADIIVVLAVVAALEHTAVQVLFFPFLAQHFIHRVRQRQRAAAGFVFHFLHGFDDNLAVFLILNDLCVEQYGFLFPIYSRPPCAQRLAAAQPQAACQHDRRVDNIPADKPQHGNQFFLGIVFAGELIFLRAVDAVKGVRVNEPVLESPFESAVQDGVIVDNGVGDNARCEHPVIKILNILCGDAADRQFPAGSKIPPNSTVYHSAVAFGGTLLNVFLDLFKVGAHIIVDRDIRGRLFVLRDLLGIALFKGLHHLSVGFVHL